MVNAMKLMVITENLGLHRLFGAIACTVSASAIDTVAQCHRNGLGEVYSRRNTLGGTLGV
jgi:hypothetical protein